MMVFSYENAFKASIEYFNGDELAAKAFVDKYALRDSSDNLLESTPDHMHDRLAREFARIEAKFSNAKTFDEIRSNLDRFKYIVPQGSPMSAIGNDYQLQTVGNCYVIDGPKDSYGSIHKTDEEETQIMKRRGGVGFDISKIRPKGLSTKNAARTTDGIGVFMDRFSNTCREVAQGGRRGALLLTIDCHHPEIETFIEIKKDLKKVTGANISIRWTDEFLQAVEAKKNVQLRFPVEAGLSKYAVVKEVNALEVWKKFVNANWTSAEPGCLFWDNVLERSPADIYADKGFRTISGNPCVSGDTWVHTSNGPKQVNDLIGKEFDIVYNGKPYKVMSRGFFKTGTKELFRLKTRNGFNVDLTSDHKVLTSSGWKEAGQLNTDDSLMIQSHGTQVWAGDGTWNEGYLLGLLVGDGTIDEANAILSVWDNHTDGHEGIMSTVSAATELMKKRSDFVGWRHIERANKYELKLASVRDLAFSYDIHHDKVIGKKIEESSSEFQKGFLRGFFDADGSVQGTQYKGVSVRLSQSNMPRLEAVQRMLVRFGIMSTIYPERRPSQMRLLPNGHGGMSEYLCQADSELIISNESIFKFSEVIGFSDLDKSYALTVAIESYKRNPNRDKFESNFVSLTPIGVQDVFDITVDTVHAFDANGITVHNCGEILMNADSCRLLLLNIFSFVIKPFEKDAFFDFDLFAEKASFAQRLMDDLIEIELEKIDKILSKIDADPEPESEKAVEKNLWLKLKNNCVMGRRTGLGLTAIGDTLAALGMRFGSKKSVDMVEQIYRTLCLSAYKSSCVLAGERGAFPIYDFNKESGHPFIEQIYEADPEIKKLAKKFGRRNIALTTTAPCGTVSLLTQTSSGIEPVFMLKYVRRKKINSSDNGAKADFVDQLGDRWQEFEVHHHAFAKWMKISGKTNVDDSPYYKATANDIDWEAGVDIQAAAQKWVCHAISRTTNLPSTATVDDIHKVYWRAWKSGCKGITVYRDGCRSGVLVSETEKSTINGRPAQIISTHAPKRPEILPCEIHQVTIKGTKWIILVGILKDKPYEMFAGEAEQLELPSKYKMGRIVKIKQGHYNLHVNDGEEELIVKNIVKVFDNPESAWSTRLVSMSLRHGASADMVVEQLNKDGGIADINKVIARVLKKYIPDGTMVKTSQKCPQCTGTHLRYEEGCVRCLDCGFSKC